MMDFVLGHGASYMEADIRDMTDQEGFCRAHFKKMFDYGNSLGNAWILKTLMKRHEEEMDHVWKKNRWFFQFHCRVDQPAGIHLFHL